MTQAPPDLSIAEARRRIEARARRFSRVILVGRQLGHNLPQPIGVRFLMIAAAELIVYQPFKRLP